MKTEIEIKKNNAIVKAWGHLWDKYKSKIIYDSWLDDSDIEPEDMEWIKENCSTGHVPDLIWRPKALSGLESNNGWTRIHEDGSNLPADKDEDVQDEYIVGYLCSGDVFNSGTKSVFADRVHELFRKRKITHYRKIQDYGEPVF